jgi:glycosyltransferase involved in cell wall biosynthesis
MISNASAAPETDLDRRPATAQPAPAHSPSPARTSAADRLRILAFVHLRNIHASTGAGRVARQLTEHLAKRDDVDLHVLADQADQRRILPLVGEPWTSLPSHTFTTDTSSQQARWYAVNTPKAEAFWPDAQIVYCTAESYVPTRSARLAVTLHDAAYFEEGAHARDQSFWKQRLKWKLLYGKLDRKADMFHTVSQFSADRIAHFFPSMTSRLRVIPNAVSPHFFSPVPLAGQAFIEGENLSAAPFLLIPGGLHFRKNADLILAAIPRLQQLFPDLTIAIVNHSNPAYAERAEVFGPKLRLLGFVEEDALRALYSAAAVVWFPSRYEGFGLPVIEAMACGTPVVASNASSLPEIAGGAALLVPPGNLEAHLEAIHSLLTDALKSDSLSRAGLERASNFTWTRSAETLKNHFDALL